MFTKYMFLIAAVILGGSSVAYLSSGCSSEHMHDNGHGHGNMNEVSADDETQDAEFTFYTCTMHPNVHGEKDGNCPLCGMKLVEKTAKKQTVCPIMGGEINKELYADHEGLRVYFCCGGCIETFKKDPEKYIKQLRKSGVEPETAK